MGKLIGTAPNQVPTNADLGTMAYRNFEQLKGTGGTVSTVGLYTVHTFTSSSSFTVSTPGIADILIVAGGGAGGSDIAGGGGAGGFITYTNFNFAAGNYTITVGAGGANAGTNVGYSSVQEGGDSVISGGGFPLLTSIGGGGGGTERTGSVGDGGSGGGQGPRSPVGVGTPGKGNNGGTSVGPSGQHSAGGGGGSAAAGQNAVNPYGLTAF